MNLKIKIIVGFRRDQEHSISMEEAHRAYYLFLNPEKRGVFDNGLAIIGNQIQEIVPDYHGTMGWNSSHILDTDDFNELKIKGVDTKIRDMMYKAKTIATNVAPDKFALSLSKLIELENMNEVQNISRGGIKSIGDILK